MHGIRRHQGWTGLRKLTASTLTVALVLAFAASSSAQPAQQIPVAIDAHFKDTGLSNFCGTTVNADIVANLRTTLVYNQAGQVVRELDRAGGGTTTYSSPDTGKSFSFPFQPIVTDYGTGAVLGSPAVFTVTGVFDKVPGVKADAGLLSFSAVVVGFNPNGVPLVSFTGVIANVGSHPDPGDVLSGFCTALT